MNVQIIETGEIKTLSIKNELGIDWTQDLIGNAGGFVDGQFEWSEDSNAYLTTQDTYDWWANYITESNTTDDEIAELANELGIEEYIIRDRYAKLLEGVNDYDDHRKVAIVAMDEIAAEYAEVQAE